MTTMTSSEFSRDVDRARRAARLGPVFVTDRGQPAHVLLTIDEYQRITEGGQTIGALLGRPEVAELAFEPSQLGNLTKPVEWD